MPGRQVELFEPAARRPDVELDDLRLRCPVQRRCEQRVLGSNHGGRCVEDGAQCLLPGGLQHSGRPATLVGADWLQRTAQGNRSAGRNVGRQSALPHVHRLNADAGRQGTRTQQHRERLEVAASAGRERPRVIHRQLSRMRRRFPGRLEVGLVGGGDLLAEPCFTSQLEGRDDTREVLGVRPENARAEQPRHRALGVAGQLGLYGDTGLGGHLAVRPRPAVRQVGQLGGGVGRTADPQNGQRPGRRRVEPDAVLKADDHQTEPGSEPVLRASSRGGEEPR